MQPSVRLICEDFVAYLQDSRNFKQVWEKEDLRTYYQSYKCQCNVKASFSTLLYFGFRNKPPAFQRVDDRRVKFHSRFMPSQSFDNVSALSTLQNSTQIAGEQFQRRRRRRRRQENATPIEHREIIQVQQSPRKNMHEARNSNDATPFIGQTAFQRETHCRQATPANADALVHVSRRGYGSKKTEWTNISHPTYLDSGGSTSRETARISLGVLEQGLKERLKRLYRTDCGSEVENGCKVTTAEQKLSDNGHSKDNSSKKPQADRKSKGSKRRVIGGNRPKFLSGGKAVEVLELGEYKVPIELKLEYRTRMIAGNPTLNASLCLENYIEKFHLLLYIEEMQYNKEIEGYAMASTTMKQNRKRISDLLHLEVPGLAENRPSLLIGDRVHAVILDRSSQEYGDTYEGFVHTAEQLQVGLGFNKKLTEIFQSNMKFRVKFTFNRRPLRLMHRALDELDEVKLREMIFPTYEPRFYQPKSTLYMNNRQIEGNKEQKTAVENIVLGKTPPIYIIFGPPGTGKTVTMVEAILQTLEKYNFNVLVCALCNDACDMLAKKLINYVDKSKIMRLYAASRNWSSVPEEVKRGSTTNYNDGVLYMPDIKELSQFRVVICTFVTAGRIASMGFSKSHYQRIFIDESGQAFEPECLVAISGILGKSGKIILAGDPKQLGPIVRSPLAIRHGLQMSLLQRLMDTCPIYQKNSITGKYNPQCVTKLVANYRSHDVILRISNKHFYDGDLQVCADEPMRSKMCGWEELPNKDFPIIFHGVEGNQTRDPSSPSYYNPEEVKIVKDYVNKLLEARGTYKLANPGQIGIVTPYRKQCEKIRRAIAKHREIDVGSVEVFQGQERLVIIISTVRSSKEGLTDDAKYHLGFLCDPKRFNVALTRAKALIIVVGNPRLLCLDKYWKSLLKYCLENKAYRGVRFSADDFRGASDMKEIENLFSSMKISSGQECDGIEDDMAAPFWRTEH